MRNYKRDKTAVFEWYKSYPGLAQRVMFLAFKHRDECPIINVTVAGVDAIPGLEMVPRSQWEDGTMTKLSKEEITKARATFADTTYGRFMTFTKVDHVVANFTMITTWCYSPYIFEVHSSVLLTLTPEEFAAELLRRKKGPTRATTVRLIGLRAAAHLNGREGAVEGPDPNNTERANVRLEDGQVLSVRPENIERMQFPRLWNKEFV